ncbi:hypothetical protein ACFL6P_02400 [Candidatus Latescibacterota bacterium]
MEYKTAQHNKKAYAYSFLLHGALLLMMMNMDVLVEVEPPKFYELNLGTVSRQRIEQIIEEAAANRILEQQAMTPEERVEVPERRMIEIDEPTISVPQEQRIREQEIVTNAQRLTVDVPAPDVRVPALDRNEIIMDRKMSFEGSKITVGEQPGAGFETGIIGAAEAINFIIEGDIKGRTLLSNPLPEYPEGLNENATIKIACIVLPDGSVSSTGMLPVRKENAVLEELAMNSLKVWRFSRLPDGADQNQKGFITFVFKVK